MSHFKILYPNNKVLIIIMSVRKAYNIEQMYLYPAVLDVYKQIENNTRQYLKTLNEEFPIPGDARYHSPGFSAKYCAYLIMETESGLIIGFKLLSRGWKRICGTGAYGS